MKYIVRTSVFILIIPESACILTAEMVDLVFYNYSLFLSIPLALLAGVFRLSKNLGMENDIDFLNK